MKTLWTDGSAEPNPGPGGFAVIEDLGGIVVGVVVMIELAGLKGREKIAGYRLESAICYEGK